MKKLVIASLVSLLVGCGGGGGGSNTTDSSNTTPAVATTPVYSISTEVSGISYPSSYNVASNQLLTVADPCNLNLPVVNVPRAWMGQNTLPQLKNTSLNKNIVRSVALSDIMLHDNPAFILDKNCKGDLQTELVKTVNRLKALGSDQIVLAQWHWASKNSDGSWYFTKAEDTYSTIPDNDLALLVRTAHAAGMKVMVLNQIQGMVDTPKSTANAYVPENTYENQVRWFDAFQPYIIERATYFQSIGVDMIDVGCGSGCIYNTAPDSTARSYDLFFNRYVSIIYDVRKVFSGKLMMVNPLLEEAFINLIDIIGLYPIQSIKLTSEENSKLTVESYKTLLQNDKNDKALRWWATNRKPIMINFGIQSRSNALTEPEWLEESGCSVASGLFASYSTSSTPCVQSQVKTDFAIQAIVTEATLEYINDLVLPSGSIVNSISYWNTDVMTPTQYSAFPNISMSVRNKPAEGIIKAWFKK